MKRVLILECEQDLAQNYSLKLNSAGFEVVYEDEREKVFEIVETFMPHFVILDHDYFESTDHSCTLVKRIKKYEISPKIIVISSQQNSPELDELVAQGAEDFFFKPAFSPALLVEKLVEL